MELVVLRDRREIYDRLQPKQPSPQRPQPRISVRAPELDEQVRSDLQSDIQAALERTLRRVQSAQPTAGREPPSNDQIREMIRAQLSSPQRPPAPERQRPLGNGGIRVATSGLYLPPEDHRTFQSEVRQLVQERLGGTSQAHTRPQVTVCGCGWPFTCCLWPPNGQLADLTPLDPLPWGPGQVPDPIKVALYFQGEGLFIRGDAILFQIWPGDDPRDPPPIPPDQILVGLRINPEFEPDQWAKEITGWTICECAVQTDHVESASAVYNWMWINKATVDTLAFRKAVTLGWHNSGYFGPTPEEFWNLLGGTVLTFDWLSDQQ